MWRSGLILPGLLALGCAPAALAPAPSRAEASPPAAATPAPPEPEPTLITLYADSWRGLDAVLIGVDEKHHRAYIKLRNKSGAPRYLIDTIQYGAGVRVHRWEATTERAATLATFDAHFVPLSDDRDADFARMASMMSRWRTRAHQEGSHWPIDDVSPSGSAVIYTARPPTGRDGDWLYLRASDQEPVRIDRGLVASYDAKFSPDGEHIAWHGCRGNKPCRYQLYVSRTRDAARGRRPRAIDDLPRPSAPVWDADGRSLFVSSQPEDGPPCVVRVPVTAAHRRQTIACKGELASFALDAAARTMVHSVRLDQRHAELTLIALDGSAEPLRHTVRGSGEVSVGPSGLVLSDHVDGVMAIDMTTGRERLLPSDDGFIYVPTTHWLANERALMLRKSFDDSTVALVLLDVARFIDSG